MSKTKEVAVKTNYAVNKRITMLSCNACSQQRVLKSDVQAYFDEIKIGSAATPVYVNENDTCPNCERKARLKAEMAADQSFHYLKAHNSY